MLLVGPFVRRFFAGAVMAFTCVSLLALHAVREWVDAPPRLLDWWLLPVSFSHSEACWSISASTLVSAAVLGFVIGASAFAWSRRGIRYSYRRATGASLEDKFWKSKRRNVPPWQEPLAPRPSITAAALARRLFTLFITASDVAEEERWRAAWQQDHTEYMSDLNLLSSCSEEAVAHAAHRVVDLSRNSVPRRYLVEENALPILLHAIDFLHGRSLAVSMPLGRCGVVASGRTRSAPLWRIATDVHSAEALSPRGHLVKEGLESCLQAATNLIFKEWSKQDDPMQVMKVLVPVAATAASEKILVRFKGNSNGSATHLGSSSFFSSFFTSPCFTP